MLTPLFGAPVEFHDTRARLHGWLTKRSIDPVLANFSVEYQRERAAVWFADARRLWPSRGATPQRS
jgi:hypothetical protein